MTDETATTSTPNDPVTAGDVRKLLEDLGLNDDALLVITSADPELAVA